MERPHHVNRRWIEHIVVLGAYTLLALLASYPLVTHIGSAIAGVKGDVWSYLWAMGWARASTLDLGVNPFRSDFVFYPLGGATQLLWATALPSFFSIPLQLAVGLIPAFNLTYLGATVLTAYGTYLLAKYVLTEGSSPRPQAQTAVVRLAAFAGGEAFAFSALRTGYGLSFTNIFHTELIPFYILFLLKTNSPSGWRNSVLAGLFLGLNVYIDFQIAAFLVLFTALWFIAMLVTWWRKAAGPPPFRTLDPFKPRLILGFARLGLIVLVSLLVSAPMITVVAQELTAEGSNYIRVYPLKYSAARSFDALSYLLPNARSSLYQSLPTPQVTGVNAAVDVDGESQLSPDRQAFLGLTVLALAVVGALSRPRALAFWIAATLVFGLFSLGPSLHFAGVDLGIPLPYAALHELPIANNIRIPMRYGVMTFLGVAILAAAGVRYLSLRIPPAPLAVVLSVLILGESAIFPYPQLNVTIPRVYDTIAAQPGDFSVLEIPTFNWRAAAATEVYQAVHHKRILRAYTNRIAPDLADYFSLRQTPVVVRTLRILEGAEEGTVTGDEIAQDREAAPAVIRFFKIRYAVLHREWLSPDAAAGIDQYLKEILGARIVAQEDTVTAYEFALPDATQSNQSILFDSDLALMYLGRGWQTDPLAQIGGESGRYVAASASELYFQVSDCNCPAPRFHFRAYSETGEGVLQFEMNGREVGQVRLKAGWMDYDIALSAESLPGGLDMLRVLHPPPQDNHVAFGSIELH